MRKHILTAAIALMAASTYAQQSLNTAENAVRYTTDNLTGTARFRAMSGAFGAVGGDLSAIHVNPAGSAIFNYNSGTASLSSYNISNDAKYFGTSQRKNDNSLDLNQLGAVFVFNNSNENAFMRKFALAFDYENTNSFHNTTYSRGINPNNSIDQYFLNYANGINEGPISLNTLNNAYYEDLNYNDQQAFLGYNAYLFNPNNNNVGPAYVSNVPSTGNYYHENYINTTGYNGKVALNFSAQLKNRLYVGGNLNIHFTDYIETQRFYEDVNNPLSTGMQSIRFDNERYTYGGGFSLNLGAIYKITESLRAGVAYESPTWMRLQNEITQRISSYCPQCEANNSADTFVFDPNTTFVFDDYTVKNPSKWTGSLAYIFGKNGLISVDYSIKDYSNTKYTSSGYGMVNSQLSSTLDVASTVRVGAEYRIKKFSLRGGYRYEQSPYKNGTTIGDLNGASGGLGYSFGASRLDLAYSWYQRKYATPLFSTGLTDAPGIKSTNNNVTLSYTIDL
ncbi:OmpP1/FadL family transporter [Flavobacterium sp. NRK1]|uniref:OmpP1/FadL family transporter n=1 Tax=Flavobacterium sp. NRK1 TaxID=2954929 RepID=UPI0020929897|nr:outer membrane protein transport protein [Flavobacterium sp. NRK1]MCO6146697.1 outer membrane protein transport protein [Flavobacterium sp. NRK1]